MLFGCFIIFMAGAFFQVFQFALIMWPFVLNSMVKKGYDANMILPVLLLNLFMVILMCWMGWVFITEKAINFKGKKGVK